MAGSSVSGFIPRGATYRRQAGACLLGGFNGSPSAYGADTPHWDARVGVKSDVMRDLERSSSQRLTRVSGVPAPAGDFSFEVWLNIDAYGSGMNRWVFVPDSSPAGQRSMRLHINDSSSPSETLRFAVSTDGTNETLVSVASFPATSLTQVIGTYNSTSGAMTLCFNDGTPGTATHSGGGAIHASTATFVVGDFDTAGAGYLDGIIGRFRLYDGMVLSSAQKTWLYNSGSGRGLAEMTGDYAALLTAIQGSAGRAWELNEASGSALDYSGNAKHLTAAGSPVGVVGAFGCPTSCDAVSSSNGPAATLQEDQGTSGVDRVQATLANCPQLRLDPTDSLPAIYRDGSDDRWDYTSGTVLTGSSGAYFASVRPSSTGTVWSVGENAANGGYLAGRITAHVTREMDISHRVANAGDVDTVRGGTVVTLDSWTTMVWISSGTAYTLRLGGSEESLTVVTADNSGDWVADIASPDHYASGALVLDTASDHCELWTREEWAVNGSVPTSAQAAASETYMGTYA